MAERDDWQSQRDAGSNNWDIEAGLNYSELSRSSAFLLNDDLRPCMGKDYVQKINYVEFANEQFICFSWRSEYVTKIAA